MDNTGKKYRKITSKRSVKADRLPTTLSVVTVRISDQEKERIDVIMKNLNIQHYSDVMRLALQMVKQQQSA